MVGQVHSEFKRQFLEMTVDKLLEQFVLSKYTGLEKPGKYTDERIQSNRKWNGSLCIFELTVTIHATVWIPFKLVSLLNNPLCKCEPNQLNAIDCTDKIRFASS